MSILDTILKYAPIGMLIIGIPGAINQYRALRKSSASSGEKNVTDSKFIRNRIIGIIVFSIFALTGIGLGIYYFVDYYKAAPVSVANTPAPIVDSATPQADPAAATGTVTLEYSDGSSEITGSCFLIMNPQNAPGTLAVATAAHCVTRVKHAPDASKIEKIFVTFNNNEGKKEKFIVDEIINYSFAHDLAVLKITADNLPSPLRFSEYDLEISDEVNVYYTIGSSENINKAVKETYISRIDTSWYGADTLYLGDPGTWQFGGPLVDSSNNVVGVYTSHNESGEAVPAAYMRELLGTPRNVSVQEFMERQEFEIITYTNSTRINSLPGEDDTIYLFRNKNQDGTDGGFFLSDSVSYGENGTWTSYGRLVRTDIGGVIMHDYSDKINRPKLYQRDENGKSYVWFAQNELIPKDSEGNNRGFWLPADDEYYMHYSYTDDDLYFGMNSHTETADWIRSDDRRLEIHGLNGEQTGSARNSSVCLINTWNENEYLSVWYVDSNSSLYWIDWKNGATSGNGIRYDVEAGKWLTAPMEPNGSYVGENELELLENPDPKRFSVTKLEGGGIELHDSKTSFTYTRQDKESRIKTDAEGYNYDVEIREDKTITAQTLSGADEMIAHAEVGDECITFMTDDTTTCGIIYMRNKDWLYYGKPPVTFDNMFDFDGEGVLYYGNRTYGTGWAFIGDLQRGTAEYSTGIKYYVDSNTLHVGEMWGTRESGRGTRIIADSGRILSGNWEYDESANTAKLIYFYDEIEDFYDYMG